MEIEFHYYVTAFLAQAAGFSEEDAQIIAYASQYVDENDTNYGIQHLATAKVYKNFISQTMNTHRPSEQIMRLYPIFHYMPGEPDAQCARRVDGKQHLLNTTPNSENANRLMEMALDSDRQIRLYWIGIAAHMYVSTWAHQNFVGWNDAFNQLSASSKPCIGHVEAGASPDWVSHRWYDNRLVEPFVNNRLRYLSAAKALFFWFSQAEECHEGVPAEQLWPQLERELAVMMGPTYTGHACRHREIRLARYRQQMPWLIDFDEYDWFDQAIETQVVGLRDTHEGVRARFTAFGERYFWREGISYDQTHWFAFQEAIKAHERAGIELLAPRFKQMGLALEKL